MGRCGDSADPSSGAERHDGGMQTRPRLVPLAGASNFRDLGGYPTTHGGATRWGRLFRSDTLHELTQDDLTVLRDLGLASIVDLRTAAELDRTGRGLLGAEPVSYLHLSVIDEDGGESRGIPAPADDDLANRYLWYLEIGRDALVQALTMVGDASSYPLVFHCAAGKDRTGVLAALVLEIVGVEREVIMEDYVLTASRMELILTRLLRSDGDPRQRRGAARGSASGRSSDDGRVSFGVRAALRRGAPVGAGGRSERRVPRGDGGCPGQRRRIVAHRVISVEEPRAVPAGLASGRRGQGYLHQHGQDGEHRDTPRDPIGHPSHARHAPTEA